MKKILIYIVLIILIVIVFFILKNKKAEIVQNPPVQEVADEVLNDKIIVEKYIRENIKTIAPEEPVLGGTWYVTLVEINQPTKTGTMTYEDGHIQGKASFSYVRNGGEVSINSVVAAME